jgi:uncharacterized iron-regulated membrane protein
VTKNGESVKLTNQLAIVIGVGVFGIVGLVLGLAVLANWSDGAIIGMVTAFGAVIVNTVVAVRNQAKTAEVLQGQDEKLATIERQTNGLSETERDDIARRAVAAYAQQQKRGDQ